MARGVPSTTLISWVVFATLVVQLNINVSASDDHERESAGDISSVFNSLLGETYVWPERFAEMKRQLKPSSVTLNASWSSLLARLNVEIDQIKRLQHAVIPSVDFAEIEANQGVIPPKMVELIHKRGVVVVRNVVDDTLASSWKDGVRAYARDNPSHQGYPKDNPQVLELYWSQPQVQARQHPNVHATLLALNALWHASDEERVSFRHAYVYGERLRIRDPGDTSFALGPHIDGGSIERYEDEFYRKLYANIYAGDWENHDAWNGGARAEANTSHYSNKPNGAARIFRTFQGWLAVSNIGAGPNTGTLRVVPLVKEATAFVLLRAFLNDVTDADFCGAIPGKSHDLVAKWHATIIDALVSIPEVNAGDMVFWHPDIIHAVDSVHAGTEDSSVFYIPAIPLTRQNARYVAKQRKKFEEGKTPPDFPPNDSEVSFIGRGTTSHLTPLGRQSLGVDPIFEAGLEMMSGCRDSIDDSCEIVDGKHGNTRDGGETGYKTLVQDCNAIFGF
eukprot:m.165989 g.165989  ORF g.165989 m.165989 type:complete len:505 (-) comp31408_c2_seq1:66-1580(-)